ncbi:MAG: hypothetical protein ACR2NL_11030, partial [Acidimicrobiia bacterium]
ADGIPGCLGDNPSSTNAIDSCSEILGTTSVGGTNVAGNTGFDDGSVNGNLPRLGVPGLTGSLFPWRDATATVVSHFSAAPYNYTAPNPPTWSTASAFPVRDLDIVSFLNSGDVLVKVEATTCPIVGSHEVCGDTAACGDMDNDNVCDEIDNCPDIANSDQADTDGDGVGQVCDNCQAIANPRELTLVGFLHQWKTTTGGQRDDDVDGYGNKCDGDLNQSNFGIGGPDVTLYGTAVGKSVTTDTCGAGGTTPCAIFDLDTIGLAVGGPDNTFMSNEVGTFHSAGRRCLTCPLTCEAGITGDCTP